MIETVVKENYLGVVEADWLRDAAQAALNYEGVDPASELSVVISDDAELQSLNNSYLGINAPTDVLSFPANEPDPESGQVYLGDVIISYPRVEEQAKTGDHSPKNELQLLVVHGVLHLLGYDHAEEDEKHAMWTAQNAILSNLGNPLKMSL